MNNDWIISLVISIIIFIPSLIVVIRYFGRTSSIIFNVIMVFCAVSAGMIYISIQEITASHNTQNHSDQKSLEK